MKKLFLFSLAVFGLLLFNACDSKDDVVTGGGDEGNTISSVNGLVEKGPFISGATVTLYELDANLNGTGKVFTGTTNNEGGFKIDASSTFASKYVKLAVTGYYFNEYTGLRSTGPITLEAITSVEKSGVANINVNTLTHLEMPRVMELAKTKKINFEDAKVQAQKEVLAAFLIKDQVVVPEETSIVGNNTSANILIAISAILLNEQSDATFTEFMSNVRQDLMAGKVSDNTKAKIAASSLGLSYSNVKENLERYYTELGKDVKIGDFELFIDGDGDGEIGDSYDEIPNDIISEEQFFTTEDNVKVFLNKMAYDTYAYLQYQHLFDAVYTNTVSKSDISRFYQLQFLYDHQIGANDAMPSSLWKSAYISVRDCNIMIEKGLELESKYDWIKKYVWIAKVYRANAYLNMTELWGDVALITKMDMSSSAEIYPSRTSKQQVIDFVIRELKDALPHLEESYYQASCSKYFALALLSRTYLYQEDNANALKYANEIIHSGRFALSADYNAIYKGGNAEIIYELPNISEGQNFPSYLPFDVIVKKGSYMPLSRYAEVLLTASQASLAQGDKNTAAQLLNQVRQRNGRPTIQASANLKEILTEEWKQDLKNEGLYFSVLKSMGIAKEMLNIDGHKLLLPIPAPEIDVNPNMVQNPGY